MYYFDLQINQRIELGEFPLDRLYPCSIAPFPFYNFEKQSKAIISNFIKVPIVFSKLFMDYKQNVDIIQSLNKATVYNNEINVYINTKCSPEYLSDSLYNDVCNILPVVTPLDNVLWYGIHLYFQENWLSPNLTEYNTLNMMYTCIYLLLKAQEAEIKTGYTIDVDKISLSTNLIHLLLNDFQGNNAYPYLIKLPESDVSKLKQLKEQRDTLELRIQDELKNGKNIAQNTEKEWNLFLHIVHDLSKNELQVVKKIIQSSSPKDKLKKISEYNVKINRIEKGKYILNGESINLVSLLEKVLQRFIHAQAFTQVYGKERTHFRLNPTTLSLLTTPKNTINYLYISFHQFRLEPSNENAINFSSLALKCLKRNLEINTSSSETLDDIIYDFYCIVNSYIKINSEIFDKISFKKLQGNASVVTREITDSILLTNQIKDFLSGLIESETNSHAYQKALLDLERGVIPTIDNNKLLNQLSKVESEIDTLNEVIPATKIILSLNIIYLFCEAIRIMLNNNQINILHVDAAKKYRTALLNIDSFLVHKVYAHLDENEIGMLEYREKYGLETKNLTDQEKQIEKARNSTVADSLMDGITELVFGLDSKNTEQIIEIKTKIREEILRYPDCDNKNVFADWLDDISNKICNKLISNCKKQTDDYQAIKESILNSLGTTSNKLPSSTVDSLATAEMLYNRYANDEFASKGFDFSCISALYYQAFEDAYNELIWSGYADTLNSLPIDGDEKKYTDILLEYRYSEIANDSARGYLFDKDYNQRNQYIKYAKTKNKTLAIVRDSCMYKSFGILMKEINRKSKSLKFCDYFSKLTGYPCPQELFDDIEFITKCEYFSNLICKSAKNRNNASHGGTLININQCINDKQTVLSDLQEIRSNNIGLIQTLLYLLRNSQ